MIRQTKDVKRFTECMQRAKDSHGIYGERLGTYTAEEYSDMTLILSDCGSAGVAVKSDGYINSFFKLRGVTVDNLYTKLFWMCVSAGGYWLSVYDGPLVEIYERLGFEAYDFYESDDDEELPIEIFMKLI